LITKLYGYLRSNSLLFYGGLFGVFFFLTGLFAPTFNTGAKRSEPNLLAVFTYYLWIGLISVIAALVLCLPLRKQRLVMKTSLFLF
jgi:glycine betaine transporter